MGLELDIHRLTYGGRFVLLTPQTIIMMNLLLRNPNSLVSYEKIEDEIYGGVRDSDLPEDPRGNISVQMVKLRKKLRALRVGQRAVETVWGTGYVFYPSRVDS